MVDADTKLLTEVTDAQDDADTAEWLRELGTDEGLQRYIDHISNPANYDYIGRHCL